MTATLVFNGPETTTYKDFLMDALYYGTDGSVSPIVVSASSTEIELKSRDTDYETTISGTGFTFDASGKPTGGTVTSITFYTDDGVTEVAIITGISWSMVAFIDALDELLEFDNGAPFLALVDLTDWVVDASSAVHGFSFNGEGATSTASITGSNHNDSLGGGDGNDTISGGKGDDIIVDYAGDDSLSGNKGDDTFVSGVGADTFNGGGGTDTLFADLENSSFTPGSFEVEVNLKTGDAGAVGISTNRDVLISIENYVLTGEFNAYLKGNGADNVLVSADGDDNLKGAGGNDTLSGGDGKDKLDGGNDNDGILGGNGKDTLKGGKGGDYLSGDKGDDNIRGNSGKDSLEGGKGDDRLDGDGGADLFIFRGKDIGQDTIRDFGDGSDRLGLGQELWGGGKTATQVVSDYADDSSGSFVLFDFGAGNTIKLNGITTTAGLDALIDIYT